MGAKRRHYTDNEHPVLTIVEDPQHHYHQEVRDAIVVRFTLNAPLPSDSLRGSASNADLPSAFETGVGVIVTDLASMPVWNVLQNEVLSSEKGANSLRFVLLEIILL